MLEQDNIFCISELMQSIKNYFAIHKYVSYIVLVDNLQYSLLCHIFKTCSVDNDFHSDIFVCCNGLDGVSNNCHWNSHT